LAGLEAAIDFPEDIEDEGLGFQRYANALERDVVKPLENLHRGYRENVYFRDGIRMVVVGRPNVGKSSLLNRLLEMDRAIVAETPGTTRDTIEEMINIEGLPVIIVDTAGLHETDLEIEKIGIERTRRSIDRADIVLFVVDLNQPITNDDLKIYSEIENRAHIVVLNKSDLKQNMTTPSEWENSTHIKISVLKNQRIDQLKKTIFFDAVLKKKIASGIIPFSIGLELGEMEQATANAFSQIIEALHPTLNQQKENIRLSKEISRLNNVPISEVINEYIIDDAMSDTELDRNQKIKKIRRKLKQIRFPEIVRFESNYFTCLKRLILPESIHLNPPADFEGRNYSMHLHFQNLSQFKAVNDVLNELKDHPDFAKIIEKEFEDN